MATVIWVAIGGAVGSLARYGLSGMVNHRAYPWGTVAVNVAGCLLLGFLLGTWGFQADTPARVGLTVGVLGGFTTFSTFALDTLYLWERGEASLAAVSLFASVVAGLGAGILGLVLGRSLSS